MTAIILSENVIPGLPSASGVEIIGATAYVIGDDSAFVHQLDAATLARTGQVLLLDSVPDRIRKHDKPDLECMAALRWPDGRPGLLLLGSGSRPNRARGWFVPIEATPPTPEALDLAPLFAELGAHLPAGVALNLEAAATTDTELLLFQRTVGRADAALLFVLPLEATLRFLGAEPWAALPAPHQLVFQLPTIDGCPAGFSGATFVEGRLFVSASVEDTGDAVLDGAVLGSFIGLVDVPAQTATFARLAWADGRAYQGKVEGLAVRRALGPNRWEMLLVTDDDAGGSTAVVAEVAVA